MAKSKARSVSHAPLWSDNAYFHPTIGAYVHGLEVFPATRQARLYVAEGAPRAVGLAIVLNMMAPDTTFADIVQHDRRVVIMCNTAREWKSGEPLHGEVDHMGEGVLIRLPAITGRPQYNGSVMRREDRPGSDPIE